MTQTKKNNKAFRLFASVLCVLLAVTVGTVSSLQLIAKATDTVYYVEDIKIYAGEGKKKAKEYFEKNGYIPANIDLNIDTDTGKDAWLGYKLTTNKDMAITDIRFMGMDTGYQLYDYDEMLEYLKAQNAGTAQTLFNLSQEFSEKYKAGSPRARDAYEGLNLFCVDDTKKTKLGDYILAGRANLDFFTQVLVKAGTGTLNAVLGFLNVGISPYENEYDEESGEQITSPWASLISKSTLWERYEAGLSRDEEDALHQQYNDLARAIFKQIQDFTALYQNAEARFNANGNKYETDLEMDDMEEAYDKMDDVELEDTDAIYLASYEMLNSYPLNEETKLGDWFISIGLKTSDEIDLKQLYPLVEAMGENQAAAVAVGGLLSAINNLEENAQNDDFRKKLPEVREQIKEYNNSESMEIFENCDDEIEGKTIGFTNDAIRKNQASLSLGKTSRYDRVKNKINEIIGYVNLAMGALFVGVTVLAFVAAAGIVITKMVCGTFVLMAALNWMFMALSSVCAVINAVMFWAGPIVLALTIGFMIGWWIGGMLREKIKNKFHSEKPDFVFDAPETVQGALNLKYRSVLDDDGDVADINRGKQWKWTIMAYTTDIRVGSPIRADKDGNIFKLMKDNPNFVNGYDCAKYFGERNAGNVNAFCEDSGYFYLHYRTDASIAAEGKSSSEDPEFYNEDDEENENENAGEETPKPEEKRNYLGDIIVCIGENTEEAKAKITAHAGGFYILDYNLSKDREHATYIGYSITTNPDDAITDLRVAPYCGQTMSFNYGDVKYTFVEILGINVGLGDEQTKPQSDALFFTRDKRAGDPILADGLFPVSDPKKAKEGWTPVSFFGSDLPYNFDTDYKIISSTGISESTFDYKSDHHSTHAISGYRSQGDHDLKDKPKIYLYYESTVKYTEGTEYLSGIFFAGGYDTTNNKYRTGEIEHDISEMIEYYINTFPNINCEKPNLAQSISDRSFKSMIENQSLYLLYTWTYNPKRAVSNIAVYQGDTFSDTLPYSISKPLDGIQQNFLAATVIQQGYHDKGTAVERYICPYNTYMRFDGMVILEGKYFDHLKASYTKELPEGIDFGYTNQKLLPTNLYICGPTEGKTPLKLSDVIISAKEFAYTEENGRITYTIPEEEKTSLEHGTEEDYKAIGWRYWRDARLPAQGSYMPIVELKNPNRLKPFNLSYPRVYDENDKLRTKGSSIYIYIRGEKQVKGKYISSLSVGSFSRKIYKESFPKASKKDLQSVDEMTEGQAMIGALSGCSDEIIIRNISLTNQSDAWYNSCAKMGYNDTVKSCLDAPENKPAAYVGVSRTNDSSKAITGVVFYQLNDTVAPNQLTLDNVDYYCAGVKAPIEMNGKTYFLYYTYNRGISPGLPIEDITIDSMPLQAGSATNLCADAKHTKPYGDADLTNFIHLKYSKSSEFFNKIYIGSGETKREAMAELLSQGCVEIMDMDINTGIRGKTILLGYRTSSVNWEKINSKKTDSAKQKEYDTQTQEAIYDIIVTSGEPCHEEGIVRNNIYYHLASKEDLNGWEGEELYLYFASPYYSSEYNKTNNEHTDMPQDVFTGYISHIALAESDRVPYNASLSSTTDTESSALKWEYVVDGDAAPVDLNAGAVSYSPHHAKDIRIYMFAQRSDGSVKPAGEITGGFVDSKYNVGELKFK